MPAEPFSLVFSSAYPLVLVIWAGGCFFCLRARARVFAQNLTVLPPPIFFYSVDHFGRHSFRMSLFVPWQIRICFFHQRHPNGPKPIPPLLRPQFFFSSERAYKLLPFSFYCKSLNESPPTLGLKGPIQTPRPQASRHFFCYAVSPKSVSSQKPIRRLRFLCEDLPQSELSGVRSRYGLRMSGRSAFQKIVWCEESGFFGDFMVFLRSHHKAQNQSPPPPLLRP